MTDFKERFSFTTDDINAPPKLSDEEAANLILSCMSMPLEAAQICFPKLDKFTYSDLEATFKNYLQNPPQISTKTKKYPLKTQLTKEEDFWLLNYLKHIDSISFEEFAEKYGHHFRPCLTMNQILARFEEIKAMTPEERQKIDDDVVKTMLFEQSFSKPDSPDEKQNLNLQCTYESHHQYDIQPHVEHEIQELHELTSLLSITAFKGNDLAILRGLSVEYAMRREAILIGRASTLSEVDVDLSSVDGQHACIHISRQQAILSFLPDCNFYIENIGNRSFRVNGVEISTGKICRIPPYAILDFCGILLMFIPNEKLLDQLKTKLKISNDK
ncbi:hypothetical protein TVAG_018040 [Trichomonas vaginalis G3]|uniref:FHA domain-containing protein n=1 Tax=Trichomonas vaginalis (strain ATCC PRA-98 / G3) TaxID=412133 RepID=A2FEU3_TRIV3|nr:G-quadruplex RNA binding [Trichomonas vaginalis G3]EAX96590.1 hypothetical protein TVAG_018040 [Trichomonas vaginalis G3]KAI5485920.1 G-quadruplex RNA binding [Trichomonas vaginalis G3]|eukprot:XP_001309520.1 hypothetical protein [Trichomonas vaginalis G3]